MNTNSKACLVDTTKCIGCRACQVACKQWNQLPAEHTRFRGTGGGYENPPALSSKTYTRITFHEIVGSGGNLQRSVFVKRQCMHCNEPACVSACPVAALEKIKQDGQPVGPVIYHQHKCIGCRYCMMACPFDVPTLQWDRLAPYIQKCTFCADRLEQLAPTDVQINDKRLSGQSLKRFQDSQQTPACAKVCPTEAIKFGDRAALIAQAQARIAKAPDTYVNHIYGQHEVGGTSWLYITSVPFKKLAFRMNLGNKAYPEYTSLALNSIPALALGLGALLGGAYWFSNRRSKIEQATDKE